MLQCMNSSSSGGTVAVKACLQVGSVDYATRVTHSSWAVSTSLQALLHLLTNTES